mgnify:CR=1 FL=1
MKKYKEFIIEVRRGAKNKKEAKWFSDFQDALLDYDRKYKGKIDWETARYLMMQNMSPQEAAQTYHENIAEARKNGTEPDGTGPHGRGAGPGKGKADGTGMKKKKKDDEDDDEEEEKDNKE